MLSLGLALSLGTSSSSAHGGGLDEYGGHYDHRNGNYHCHTADCKKLPPYDRDDWPHWIFPTPGVCQDMRATILIRDSQVQVTFRENIVTRMRFSSSSACLSAASHEESGLVTSPQQLSPELRKYFSQPRAARGRECIVHSGRWFDPYTGTTFKLASKLDIDHIVPLQHAHFSGGAKWTQRQKMEFANDPENLLAVDAVANRKKGAKSPLKWKPRKEYWCEYAKQWEGIKKKYDLYISNPEEQELLLMKEFCLPLSSAL